MSKESEKEEKQQKDKDELTLTPGGWRPKSKVHYIEPGQHIDGSGGRLKIVDTATGKIIEDLGEIPEVGASEPKMCNSETGRRAGKTEGNKEGKITKKGG